MSWLPYLGNFNSNGKSSSRLKHLYNTRVYPFYIQFNTWREYRNNSRAPLAPNKIIWVKTDEITKYQIINRSWADINRRASHIRGGDWDLDLPDFEEYDLFKFIRDAIIGNTEVEQTEFFNRFTEELENRPSFWHGCTSVDDFYSRCEYLERLYLDMRENGIQSSYARRKMGDFDQKYPDDINVNIGRNGELIHYNGRHRLSIAKVIEIDYIPVNVTTRHQEWQNKRDQFYICSDPSFLESRVKQYVNHPDMNYLMD